jgi:hypothetical protein
MNHAKISKILTVLFAAIICFGPVGMAGPIAAAFTYQGRLIDNNSIADGLYDFQFKLYNAEFTTAMQIGPDVNKPDVEVIDGYFTVELNFGDVFDGNERWLDIGVRPGEFEDPNVYAVLSPRQQVTPAPYAVYAESAGNSGADSDWIITGGNMYSGVSGNVGIGTTNPTAKLDVEGAVKVTGGDNYYGINASSSNTTGSAVYGQAAGASGTAVQGWANDSGSVMNFGGVFQAEGEEGRGVYGAANNTANAINFGGYFRASGGLGRGVGGSCTGDNGVGVYGSASGSNGTGVIGSASGSSVSKGVYGLATSATGVNIGVYGKTNSSDGYAGYFEGGKNYFEGNVGIGTRSPAEALDVNGTAKAVAFVGDGSGLTNLPASPDSDWTVSGSDIYSAVSGNVGIGTTSPTQKLHVRHSAVGSNVVKIENTATVNSLGLSVETGSADNSSAFRVVSAGSINFYVTNAGKVGIGTSSPANELGVDGAAAIGTSYASIRTAPANGLIVQGSVGIGTYTPARSLHVSDVMRLQPRALAPSSPAEGDIYMNSTTHKLMVYDGTDWQACW